MDKVFRVKTPADSALTSIKWSDFLKSDIASADRTASYQDEKREDTEVGFWMHRLVDNAAGNRLDWNFFNDNLRGISSRNVQYNNP